MTVARPIRDYGQQLSLGDEPAVLDRANDLYRRIQLESNLKMLKMSFSCQAILSLHVASRLCHRPTLDVKKLAALAGLAKSKYQKLLQNAEKALAVDIGLTVEEICIQLGCIQVRAQALTYLDTYRQHLSAQLTASRRDNLNFDRSIYPCAATLAACQSERIRVDREKLSDLSGSSKTELDRLALEIKEAQTQAVKTPKKRKANQSLVEAVLATDHESLLGESQDAKAVKGLDDDLELAFDRESYDAWKLKIMQLAGLAT